MKTQTSADGTAIRIWGDNSPNYITLTTKLYSLLGSDAAFIFHKYHELKRADYLPYFGCDSHPLESKAWNYALKNRELGYRKWRWGKIRKEIGVMFWKMTGYFYEDDDFAVSDKLDDTGEYRRLELPEHMKKYPLNSTTM